jgi:transcriptional regulator with XRE-family HTH domain
MLDLEKVRSLRERRGMTQAEAAKAAGLARSENNARQRWSAIEGGRRANVTLETLGRIAKALGVNPRDLLRK